MQPGVGTVRKMEGAGRIFAGEYQKARCTRADYGEGSQVLLTPGGMVCRLLFLAGTLTEKKLNGTELFYGRVADPTGVFELRKFRPDPALLASLSAIGSPAFVTVLGQARAGSQSPHASPFVELLEIREVDRGIRDTWIIRTAETTLDRLSRMKETIGGGIKEGPFALAASEFGMNDPSLRDLAEMACQALGQVSPSGSRPAADPGVKEQILAIIRESAGKKGLALGELVDLAGRAGIEEAAAREAVKALLEEDECYQPAREVYKPL